LGASFLEMANPEIFLGVFCDKGKEQVKGCIEDWGFVVNRPLGMTPR
jgi:hypothetical protein